MNYDYSGPQVPAKIRVAIGRVGVFGFDEVVYKVVSITVPETPEKKTYQTPVDIYISSAMTAQPGYDLYTKIVDIPGADIYSPTYHNVIEITEEAPPPPPPDQYTLSIGSLPVGVGYVTKSPDKAVYDHGETVIITGHATATLPGIWKFDHWILTNPDGSFNNYSNPLALTMIHNWGAVCQFSF